MIPFHFRKSEHLETPGGRCGKRGNLCVAGEAMNRYKHWGNQCGGSLKKKIELAYNQLYMAWYLSKNYKSTEAHVQPCSSQ